MNATSTAAFAQALLQIIPQSAGSGLLGSYLASVLYGVTVLQTYQYFSRYYKRDSIYLSVLVVILTLLDTVALVLNMVAIWLYLIKNFDNPLAILHLNWTISSSLVVTVTLGFLVQLIYAHRAYILGGRKIWIPAIILICGASGLVEGLVYAALLIKSSATLDTHSIAVGLFVGNMKEGGRT